jgi:hypothetical protein
MTVRDNVAFGLQIRGDREARAKADALLDKLALRGFGDRFPKDLSGGMRQRVALARCLALDAPMLLMDEPFGALDALTRRSMQDELLRIWTELKQTIAFVTHGIEESLLLADRVVVMTYRPGTVKKIIPVAPAPATKRPPNSPPPFGRSRKWSGRSSADMSVQSRLESLAFEKFCVLVLREHWIFTNFTPSVAAVKKQSFGPPGPCLRALIRRGGRTNELGHRSNLRWENRHPGFRGRAARHHRLFRGDRFRMV